MNAFRLNTFPMNKYTAPAIVCSLVLAAFAGTAASQSTSTQAAETPSQESVKEKTMQLGNFSVSLAVKDIKASKAFYEKLDFQEVGGKLDQNWIILQNGTTTIGLFQGMFEKNIMTFNPGWNKDAETLKEFQDVRELQSKLRQRGIQPVTEADASSKGPASFVLNDPDGNMILFDQHVPKPE
jgi:predicted lactoylglutathione lyase